MTVLQLVQPARAADRSAAPSPPRVLPSEWAWCTVARALGDDDGTPAPSDAEVRAAVTRLVAHLKARGCTPERMLVLMKGMAHGALTMRREPATGSEYASRMARLTTWSIEAYYGIAS